MLPLKVCIAQTSFVVKKLSMNSSIRLHGIPFSDAESRDVEDTTVNVWEDNWDDDAKEDDFANQLRLEQFVSVTYGGVLFLFGGEELKAIYCRDLC